MKVTPSDLILSLKRLLMLSAVVQIIILVVYAARTGEFGVLNIFRILQVNRIFPQILEIPSIDIIAFLFTIIVFLVILFITVRKK